MKSTGFNSYTTISKKDTPQRSCKKNISTRNYNIERFLRDLDELEVEGVIYSLLSAEDIKAMSVIEITNPKMNEDEEYSLYDPKLGPSSRDKRCTTCGLDISNCLGHFGYVGLYKPFYNFYFLQTIKNVLNCLCQNPRCNRVIFSEELLEDYTYSYISDLKENKRIKEIADITKNYLLYCPHCETTFMKDDIIEYTLSEKSEKEIIKRLKKKPKIVDTITVENVKELLKNITIQEARLLGFSNSHPKDMIIDNLLILPPKYRQSAIINGMRKDHSLTILYSEIIKNNQSLRIIPNTKKEITTYESNYKNLKANISSLYGESSSGKSGGMRISSNDMPIGRLGGSKEGFVRSSILGKRTNFSSRAVISPGSYLRYDQVGVPRYIAEHISISEEVTDFNYYNILELLDENKIVYINKPSGYKFPGNSEKTSIEIGDIIERKLMNGDIVIINRPPSLSRYSTMAHEVIIVDTNTIILPVSSTSPYNADFDGDCMQLFVPQSKESIQEAKDIIAIKKNILNISREGPIIGGILDHVSGAYILTSDNTWISSRSFNSIAFAIHRTDIIDSLEKRCLKYNIPFCRYIIHNNNKDYELSTNYNSVLEDEKKFNKFIIIYEEFFDKFYAEKNLDFLRNLIFSSDYNINNDNNSNIEKEFFYCKYDKNKNSYIIFDNMNNTINIDFKQIDDNSDICKIKDLYIQNEIIIDKKFYILDWNLETIKYTNFKLLSSIQFPEIKKQYYGKTTFSLLLNEGFYYNTKGVLIKDGVLIDGVMNVGTVGAKKKSIIHYLAIDDPDSSKNLVGMFLTNLQWMINMFLQDRGFTINLNDVIINDEEMQEIINVGKKTAYDTAIKLEKISKELTEDFEKKIMEEKISSILGKTMGIGKEFINGILYMDNNFNIIVNSGAKGKDINLAQVLGLLGPQLIGGVRIKPSSETLRTYPSFEPEDVDPMSRGFCMSSFSEGLSPVEFFSHAAGSREGIIDTAIKTSNVGYLNRTITRYMESISINDKYSSISSNDEILQLLYGGDGLNPARLINVSISSNENFNSFIDVKNVTFELNGKNEMDDKIFKSILNKYQ